MHPIEFKILFTRLNSQSYSPDRIQNSIQPIEFTILFTRLKSQFYATKWIHNSMVIKFTKVALQTYLRLKLN